MRTTYIRMDAVVIYIYSQHIVIKPKAIFGRRVFGTHTSTRYGRIRNSLNNSAPIWVRIWSHIRILVKGILGWCLAIAVALRVYSVLLFAPIWSNIYDPNPKPNSENYFWWIKVWIIDVIELWRISPKTIKFIDTLVLNKARKLIQNTEE